MLKSNLYSGSWSTVLKMELFLFEIDMGVAQLVTKLIVQP